MSLQAVTELAAFATNAVTQADRLIALAGQGLNWMKHELPSQHLRIGLPGLDPDQKFFIGGSQDGNPKPNSTVTTIGDVLSDQNLEEAVQWLTVSCLIEICSFWSSNTRKALAAELGIAEPKYFNEPVLKAAVLRRNDCIHSLGNARKQLEAVGPFGAIEIGSPIRITPDELRDFRGYLSDSLPRISSVKWIGFARGKRHSADCKCL